jgi:hypothetical protein
MPEQQNCSQRHRWTSHVGPFLLLVALAATAAPSPAFAIAIDVDEFSVTRNGNPLFDDTFNQNTTLIGGLGTTVASGVNFAGGTAANYFVHGSIPETTANNGQAQLNTANGIVVTQPDPFFPVIREVNANLETSQNSAVGNALTQASAFTATALFDLHLPTVVGGSDVLDLNNRYGINSNMGNVLQIRLRDCSPGIGLCGALSGPVVQFVFLDFITNGATLISEFGLSAADLADPQFVFEFEKAANTNVIDACYAAGTGNTLASFGTVPTCFASTDVNSDVFTSQPGGDTVRAAFDIFEPVSSTSVPEPSSLPLLAIGLLVLGGLACRQRRSADQRPEAGLHGGGS